VLNYFYKLSQKNLPSRLHAGGRAVLFVYSIVSSRYFFNGTRLHGHDNHDWFLSNQVFASSSAAISPKVEEHKNAATFEGLFDDLPKLEEVYGLFDDLPNYSATL